MGDRLPCAILCLLPRGAVRTCCPCPAVGGTRTDEEGGALGGASGAAAAAAACSRHGSFQHEVSCLAQCRTARCLSPARCCCCIRAGDNEVQRTMMEVRLGGSKASRGSPRTAGTGQHHWAAPPLLGSASLHAHSGPWPPAHQLARVLPPCPPARTTDHEPAGRLRATRQHQGAWGTGVHPLHAAAASGAHCTQVVTHTLPSTRCLTPPKLVPATAYAGAAGHQPARHPGPGAAAPRPRGPPRRWVAGRAGPGGAAGQAAAPQEARMGATPELAWPSSSSRLLHTEAPP